MRRRPIFLLEIVIAIALVGFFSFYFLLSSIHFIYQERKALFALEFERLCDLERMDLIKKAWNQVETLNEKTLSKSRFSPAIKLGGKSYVKTKLFKIWCAGNHENLYDLVLQEKSPKKDPNKEKLKKYHFLVKKEKPEAKAAIVIDSSPTQSELIKAAAKT